MKNSLRLLAVVSVSLFITQQVAIAQQGPELAYPTRPIRMLCGFSAGGGSDFAARIVGAQLTQLLGQSVIIDNRTGANGAIAAEITARAPAAGALR